MLVPVATLVVLAAVTAAHRTLDGLARIRIRHAWLVALAIGTQIAIIEVLPDRLPLAVAAGLHLASYGAALAFVWLHRRQLGIAVIGLGGLANLAAIAANDGQMPAAPAAAEAAGLDERADADDGFENSTSTEDARLAALGDVFAIPEPWPLANVFSVGDVAIVVGAGVLADGSARAARRERRTAAPGATGADDEPGHGPARRRDQDVVVGR